MKKHEWLVCNDPQLLLRFLFCRVNNKKLRDRKLRLLSVAGCRRLAVFLNDPELSKSLEMAELLAESLAVEEEEIRAQIERLESLPGSTDAHDAAWNAVRCAIGAIPAKKHRWGPDYDPYYQPSQVPYWAMEAAYNAAAEVGVDPYPWNAAKERERAAQVRLIRDIFGNPFRPVTLDPSWQTATVLALAEAIYADRAFDRLPILADALEEAGCTSADILNHCLQPGEHVRGCWVVDLVLGKQ